MHDRRWLMMMYLALGISVSAVLGSLYFSEILHWIPCKLCWWQRIAMYPLVPIISVGILRRDRGLPHYVLPLSILGGLVAFYHTLLQYNLLPESAATCSAGVSCTTKYLALGGVITIPLMSLLAFAAITGLMLAAKHKESK